MYGSWKIGRVAGIGLYVHWTFLLLLAWVIGGTVVAGGGWWSGLVSGALIVAIFTCVVLHELGHALAARRYGIPTRDISLLPIGGVARLERMPEKPEQELVVALAGPAVNVIILVLLGGLSLAILGPAQLLGSSRLGVSFIRNLLMVNGAMVVFNMLPAFPMDGGRVLRAILAMGIDYGRATDIAANIGKGLAVALALAGLFWLENPILAFIGVFVYFGANNEARFVAERRKYQGIRVADAMLTQFQTLTGFETLGNVAGIMLRSLQPAFPVINRGVYEGMIFRSDVAEALHNRSPFESVSLVLRRTVPRIPVTAELSDAVGAMRSAQSPAAVVFNGATPVGLLTLQNVDMLLVNVRRNADTHARSAAPESMYA
ncbi:Putative zinc metalloprotease Rip3 [Maioricimonas rarisocia]|uniref:Zinc metalloprotease n=1 Tax=Maioricimonas rarisocia TaxID=2528026 RepID=A0A517Z7P4_9PLAN|nr:site-2 protease family protein [Maioricimonas rarisocia]QDU38507.1 Putative zinc metalloprotease Rip3 [Maioricimonas rarisocia]